MNSEIDEKIRDKKGRFVKGFGFKKGVKFTKEHIEKISIYHKGKHFSPKTEFKKGHIEKAKEIRENLSKAHLGKLGSFKGKHHSENEIRKMVQTRRERGSYNTSWNKGLPSEKQPRHGKHNSDASKKKLSNKKKELYKNPEFKDRMIKAQLKGLFVRPTTLEQAFIEFIKTNNLPYKYVGNGEFVLGGKNPDFVNTDGQKICIDVRCKEICMPFQKCTPEQYEISRKKHFSKYGWDCVVIFPEIYNKKEWIFNESEILKNIKN